MIDKAISHLCEKDPEIVTLLNSFKIEDLTRSAVHLTLYGWKTEAIPLIQTKKSLITKIFKTLFG